jgi:sugar lactone lactonase YvrE
MTPYEALHSDVSRPGRGAHAMDTFVVRHQDFSTLGSGLRRPECVLTTAAGEIYASDVDGVRLIRPDGSTRLFSGRNKNGEKIGANGFALMPDGSFLVSALFGGGVYHVQRDGSVEPYLLEVDGHPIECPNFVLVDRHDRVWIACLTRQDRKTISSFPRNQRDGYIVRVDERGAKVVADHINYPNEIRINEQETYLYTNETTAGRLLRYPLSPEADLGEAEVIVELDDSNMLDGFTLDSEGGAWLTALISNRIWYVSPTGELRLLIEEYEDEQLGRLVEQQRTTGVCRALLYEDHGCTLANISSLVFGGPDLKTAYLGSLMGDHLLAFRSPVAGLRPTHWQYGPFD